MLRIIYTFKINNKPIKRLGFIKREKIERKEKSSEICVPV